jgi:hypothetical protein
MDERRRVARASAWLAALLWAGALMPGPVPPAPCASGREARARDGWTRAVSCSPGAEGDTLLRGPGRLLFDLPIDANFADAATLEVLPGIGPARARAWVLERERAPLRGLHDLERVPGIGPGTSARLAPYLAFGSDPPKKKGGLTLGPDCDRGYRRVPRASELQAQTKERVCALEPRASY